MMKAFPCLRLRVDGDNFHQQLVLEKCFLGNKNNASFIRFYFIKEYKNLHFFL